jgi:hypothetical protein
MYFAVTFRGQEDKGARCMGFCFDEERAQSLARALGEGAGIEELEGTFPLDVYLAADEWEAAHNAEVKPRLRIVREIETADTIPPSAADPEQTGVFSAKELTGSGLYEKVGCL